MGWDERRGGCLDIGSDLHHFRDERERGLGLRVLFTMTIYYDMTLFLSFIDTVA